MLLKGIFIMVPLTFLQNFMQLHGMRKVSSRTLLTYQLLHNMNFKYQILRKNCTICLFLSERLSTGVIHKEKWSYFNPSTHTRGVWPKSLCYLSTRIVCSNPYCLSEKRAVKRMGQVVWKSWITWEVRQVQGEGLLSVKKTLFLVPVIDPNTKHEKTVLMKKAHTPDSEIVADI